MYLMISFVYSKDYLSAHRQYVSTELKHDKTAQQVFCLNFNSFYFIHNTSSTFDNIPMSLQENKLLKFSYCLISSKNLIFAAYRNENRIFLQYVWELFICNIPKHIPQYHFGWEVLIPISVSRILTI